MSVTDINAKKPPVVYTVRIVQHWDGKVEYLVEDLADDQRSRNSVAGALRAMADALSAAPPVQQGEREAFEHWFDTEDGGLGESYDENEKDLMWWGWQARSSIAQQEQPQNLNVHLAGGEFEQPPELKSWPKRIWLTHASEEICDFDHAENEGTIYWVGEPVDGSDVEYVRADLALRGSND